MTLALLKVGQKNKVLIQFILIDTFVFEKQLDSLRVDDVNYCFNTGILQEPILPQVLYLFRQPININR